MVLMYDSKQRLEITSCSNRKCQTMKLSSILNLEGKVHHLQPPFFLCDRFPPLMDSFPLQTPITLRKGQCHTTSTISFHWWFWPWSYIFYTHNVLNRTFKPNLALFFQSYINIGEGLTDDPGRNACKSSPQVPQKRKLFASVYVELVLLQSFRFL